MRDDSLSITDALHTLVSHYGRAPSYPSFWRLVVAGRVPAHRYGREWFVKRADLPKIAKALGLTPDAGRAA